MMGCNHVITNVMSFAALAAVGQRVFPKQIQVHLDRLSGPGLFPGPVYIGFAAILFVLGSLLPDIDNKKSTLGRYVHLPVRHRGITHSVFALAILTCMTLAFKPFFWVLLGYALHILGDSVSAAGICWFYPVTRYRDYPNGAFVKPGHKVKLYHAGETSETLFVMLYCLAMACVVAVMCF